MSKSTVQNHLVDHGLGRRHQRLARTAAIAALTTDLVTKFEREVEPFRVPRPATPSETRQRRCPHERPADISYRSKVTLSRWKP